MIPCIMHVNSVNMFDCLFLVSLPALSNPLTLYIVPTRTPLFSMSLVTSITRLFSMIAPTTHGPFHCVISLSSFPFLPPQPPLPMTMDSLFASNPAVPPIAPPYSSYVASTPKTIEAQHRCPYTRQVQSQRPRPLPAPHGMSSTP
jgi:hypothetical protein